MAEIESLAGGPTNSLMPLKPEMSVLSEFPTLFLDQPGPLSAETALRAAFGLL